MDRDDAMKALDEAEVVPCAQAPVGEAKELLDACLDEEIPALLDRAACCGSSGCGCAPKLALLVRPDDVPRVAALLDRRWRHMLNREGTIGDEDGDGDAQSVAADERPLACPACGALAPNEPGPCPDCGLTLA